MQGAALQDNCPFLGARKERKEHPPSPKAPPYMEGMQPLLLSLRHLGTLGPSKVRRVFLSATAQSKG